MPDGVALLTLTDPATRNSLSDQMIDALQLARSAIDIDSEIRALIITGDGDTFSAGGNLDDMLNGKGMFSAETPFEAREMNFNTMHRIPALIFDIAIPTIAAVNGPAIGGGCDVTLMCDIRLASENAIFSEAFLRVGLVPGDGGAWFLPRIVGLSRAMEMALTSRFVGASDAERIGLVSRTVEHSQLLNEAYALARKIASQPPNITRLTKRLIRFGAESTLSDTLEMSANMQAQAQTSEEHRTAVKNLAAAIASKR
ncbi:enoyl-CoA hydratase/isomerase family protein [Alcaligenaceae bacterium CGII-47]|nr:enoyl-CoA hydratase/isomerase family protein [Alcaligenaceae bacterium CGII-47]